MVTPETQNITGANETKDSLYRLPFPSGVYHPSLAPTPEQREKMLQGKDSYGKARLEAIWARYVYVPSPDAAEYDGPHDAFGDPDFVCYKRWEAARQRALARPSTLIGTPPAQMLDENGFYTDEYFTYCVNVLRYVCEFAESSLPDSDSCPHDFFDSIEGVIEVRQVFAMAPKALRAVTDTFRQTRRQDEECSRKRLHAVTKPLAPLVAALGAVEGVLS